MITDTLRLGTLLLMLGAPLVAQAQCPAGQIQVCLGGSCLCVPDPVRVREDGLNLAAARLEAWLLQSRQAALRAGTEPIPLMIRAQLAPFYDDSLLDEVRFRVGITDEMDVATVMLQNPDVQAVTLVDVVVFRDAQAAAEDSVLWAHELWHVQQYREWGTSGFAERYTRNFQSVEGPAYEMGERVRKVLREQK
ncbi:Uncharacterised protein [Ectopseudomonas mendocina]|uniref:eCIS core domain-containing protein n=1 Tax=Ectopseudomonas mendocina TaxID=300 RepID=A0A379IW91_ECTME|nr:MULTISPECIES: DUF4157 domain-containing protein [Pseudomonas]AEB58097.1 hypothetical protein MDS_2066 [Pseudomonas mendocina NK-01]TRO40000.1 DUF4157 domain-containing protein [Pseudomonas sp. ALS1131]SUD27835.1 Uncharacterised protein [Pseudomonas mendocina]SUD40475.1 Uncharacterised protein [Pseudomonas mendocina]